MKVFVIILLSFALIAGLVTIFFTDEAAIVSFDNESSQPTINIREPSDTVAPSGIASDQSIKKVATIPTLAKKQMEAMLNKPDHSLDSQKRAELETLVEEKQVEIDTLITSLNDNLQNSVERAKIQSKLDATIEQYNALLLPLALEKMTASVND